MKHRTILLTGSDAPDRAEVLHRASAMIARRIGEVEAASEVCASAPWGFEADTEFLNQALAVRTDLEPEQVLDEVLRIECELGRQREAEAQQKALTGQPYASRAVDIDVMFYDDVVLDTPRLTLPHPLLHVREFALRPLCMIAGDVMHPVLGLRLRDIYDGLRRGAADNENV